MPAAAKGSSSEKPGGSVLRYDPPELKQRLSTDRDLCLLDVRESWEWQICHIEGSRHIPMSEIAQRLAELDFSRELVVICHHGARSEQVALFLERSGHRLVANLEGGVAAWAQQVDHTMPVY